MSLLYDYMEKIADDNFNSEKELELIKKAQGGDKLAYKKLAKMFSGAIESAVSISGVNLPNVSKETLRMKAMGQFRRSIEVFDPDAGVKPSSFITNNIKLDLKKLDWEYKNSSRVSADLTLKAGNINSAMKQLQAEGNDNPTDIDISKIIKTNFEKDISPDEIGGIRKRQRKELSGGKVIGSVDEAEDITFGDLNNVGKVTGEDHLKSLYEEDRMNEALATLSEQDRTLLSQREGMGKFKDSGQAKFSEVAKSNNLDSEYFAKKEVNRIKDQLRGKLNNDS